MDGDQKKSTSPAWWLLSLLGVVGGIIAWEIIRETDRQKALRILVVGIVLTVAITVISTIIAVEATEDDYEFDKLVRPDAAILAPSPDGIYAL